MDRGGPNLYTGSKYRVSSVLYRKSREEVATAPLRRTYYKKYLRRTRVKCIAIKIFPQRVGDETNCPSLIPVSSQINLAKQF